MSVGTVSQLWRYPVKSMAGEHLESAQIDRNGVAGDRGWAVREVEADVTRNAREMPGLLQFAAAYAESPSFEHRSPAVTITTPDDREVQSADDDRDQRLSVILGRPVMLTPLHPADDLAWYARGALPEGVDQMTALRQLLGMQADDPIPDLSGLPQELQGFSTPPGTYFDCYPMHIMTTASLNELAALGGGDDVDVRRFRPNVVIDTGDASGLLEVDWTGKRLRLGEVVLELKTTTVRCSVPAHAQRNFGASRAVGRALIEHTKQHLGSYCYVAEGGAINVGDPVELID